MRIQRLYEISDEIERLIYSADENGELTPEALQRLDELELAFNEKIDACLAVLKNKKAHLSQQNETIRQLQRRKSTTSKEIGFLEYYISSEMLRMNRKRVETALHKVTVTSSRGKIDVLDIDALPDRLKRTESKVFPDKDAIRQEMKETGSTPDGVTFTKGHHLRVS